jgi:DNA-3-methyladenine glycosylase
VHSRTPEGETSGRIVEVEAYLGESDPASHAARLRRGRVESMWGPAGIAYVYCSHGVYPMFNVVTEPERVAGAVLVRALQPVTGLALMERRRNLSDPRRLCSGPGRLCRAMGITLDDHGVDLTLSERIWIAAGPPPASVSASGRIGVSRGGEAPWRFFETGSPFVSAHRRGVPLAP